MRDRLLGISIIYKVLIANTAIVVLGAVGGTWVTLAVARAEPLQDHLRLYVLFAGLGVIASVAVNYLVLRAAFAPLIALERTVTAVQNGDVDARAPRSAVTDPRIEQLRTTLNDMLDALARYRARLRALSSQVITAQEEERKRISRELHDETAQALTSLLVRLRLLQGTQNLEDVRHGIAELRELTARTVEDVRKLAVELRPTMLDNLGLVAAIEWYSRELSHQIDAPIDFNVDGVIDRLPADVELVIYRVVQEALTNLARHARATHASVELIAQDDGLEVRIADNGVGFDLTEATSSRERGLGLFGMRERVELIGGSFLIRSAPGAGTTMLVRVPLGVWEPQLAPIADEADRVAAG